MEFLVQNFQFIIFLDLIAIIVLLFSFVAHQRQGFYGIDMTNLIYFTAFRFLILVLESFIFVFSSLFYDYLVIFWLVLSSVSFVFMIRFSYKTLPFSNTFKTSTTALIIFSFFVAYFFYGLSKALLIAYSLFALLAFGTTSILAFKLGNKFHTLIFRTISLGQIILSMIYVLLAIVSYYNIYEGASFGFVSGVFFLRAIFTIIVALSMFFLYTREHFRLANLSNIKEGRYSRKLEIGMILVVFSFSVLSFFVFNYAKNIDEENWLQEATSHLELHAQSEKKGLEVTEGIVRSLGGSTVFGVGIKGNDAQKSMIDAHAKISPGDILYVMNKDGLVIDSTNRDEGDSFVGANYSFRPYFQEAIKGDVDFDYDYVAVGFTSKKPGYYVANKIIDREGGVIGVVAGKRTLTPFAGDYPGECTFFADSDMVIVESDCKEIKFKAILPISDELKSEKINSLQLPEIIETSGIVEELNPYLDNEFLYGETSGGIRILLQKTDDPLYVGILDSRKINYFSLYIIFILFLSLLLFLLVIFFTKVFDHQVIESITQKEKETEEERKNVVKEKKEIERLNKFMVGRELKMVELKKELQRLKNLFDKKNNV